MGHTLFLAVSIESKNFRNVSYIFYGIDLAQFIKVYIEMLTNRNPSSSTQNVDNIVKGIHKRAWWDYGEPQIIVPKNKQHT